MRYSHFNIIFAAVKTNNAKVKYEFTSVNSEKKRYSFKKAFEMIPLGQANSLKADLWNVLNIGTGHPGIISCAE